MTAAPAVSIIIPCYRQAHFLPTAVDSVLRQSYPAIEPIVVNDGSDDDTEQVAARYGDRIRYLWKPNGGLPSARNAGIRAATGRYLLFLDSDDALHPDAVAWLVEAADNRDDRLCVMGYRFFVNSPDEADGETGMPPEGRDAVSRLIVRNPAPPNSYLCSRRAVLAIGLFEESLKSCEDWDVWCRLLLDGAKLAAVPKLGAYYRRYSGSMSTNDLRMAQTRCEVRLRTLAELRRRPHLADRLGMELRDVERALREGIRDEMLDAAHLLRGMNQYPAAAVHYARSITDGYWNRRAVAGLLKLVPHRVFRHRLRR